MLRVRSRWQLPPRQTSAAASPLGLVVKKTRMVNVKTRIGPVNVSDGVLAPLIPPTLSPPITLTPTAVLLLPNPLTRQMHLSLPPLRHR